MRKKTSLLTAASLIIAATAINTQAAPSPIVYTNATVLQNVTFQLMATAQGAFETNKKQTVITATVSNVTLNTKSVIAAIGLATSNNFTSTAKLILLKNYAQDTNYEYTLASTNVTATSTNTVSFSTNLSASDTTLSFEVPFVLAGVTNTNILTTYTGVRGIGVSNIINLGQTNFLTAGLTNTTVLTLQSNVLFLGNTSNRFEVIDGANIVVVSNNVLDFGAGGQVEKGTASAIAGVPIYDTESGKAYGIAELTLNGYSGGFVGWRLDLAGFNTTTITSQSVEPTHAQPEFIDIDTYSMQAYGTGVMYLGSPTNLIPAVVQGSFSTSLYKTILSH